MIRKIIIPMLLVVLAGCVRDAVNDGGERYGSLDLGSITTGSVAETRAETDDYTVSVWRKFTNGEEPAGSWKLSECNGKVDLPVAHYRMEIRSSASAEPAGFDCPWYVGWLDDFAIVAGTTTKITEDVECELRNIKVTVRYSDALKALLFDPNNGDFPTLTTVKINDGKLLTFQYDDLRSGYFSADGVTETTEVTVMFQGMVDYKKVVDSQTITGIAAGQWERIFLTLDSEDGKTFRIVVFGSNFDSEVGQIGDGTDWF